MDIAADPDRQHRDIVRRQRRKNGDDAGGDREERRVHHGPGKALVQFAGVRAPGMGDDVEAGFPVRGTGQRKIDAPAIAVGAQSPDLGGQCRVAGPAPERLRQCVADPAAQRECADGGAVAVGKFDQPPIQSVQEHDTEAMMDVRERRERGDHNNLLMIEGRDGRRAIPSDSRGIAVRPVSPPPLPRHRDGEAGAGRSKLSPSTRRIARRPITCRVAPRSWCWAGTVAASRDNRPG